MPDREKVIKGLECCLANGHNNCPYKSTDKGIDKVTTCTTYLMQDALALLKAQEPIEPNIIDTANSKLYHNDMFKNYYCGNCGEFLHIVNKKDLFCSQCGKAAKWDGAY